MAKKKEDKKATTKAAALAKAPEEKKTAPKPTEVAVKGHTRTRPDGDKSNNKAPKAKTRKRAKKVEAAPVVEILQPTEVVVGRFYEVEMPTGLEEPEPQTVKIYGECVDIPKKEIISLDQYKEGQPTGGIVNVFYKNFPTREVSRELCFELSMSHIQ